MLDPAPGALVPLSGDKMRWAALYTLVLADRDAFCASAAAAAEAAPELHTTLIAAATRALNRAARALDTAAACSTEGKVWLIPAGHVGGITACCRLAP